MLGKWNLESLETMKKLKVQAIEVAPDGGSEGLLQGHGFETAGNVGILSILPLLLGGTT